MDSMLTEVKYPGNPVENSGLGGVMRDEVTHLGLWALHGTWSECQVYC